MIYGSQVGEWRRSDSVMFQTKNKQTVITDLAHKFTRLAFDDAEYRISGSQAKLDLSSGTANNSRNLPDPFSWQW